MDCQICGKEIDDLAYAHRLSEDEAVHLNCLNTAEERASHEAKSVIRGEQEGGGGDEKI